MKRLPLFLSLLAVIVFSASLAYWVLQLYTPQQRPLAAVPSNGMAEPSVEAAATLFGGQPLVVASNYQLTGVVAAGAEGVAILVADGQPALALPVGKEIAPGVVVKEVHPRYVILSEGGVMKRIELATDDKMGASIVQAQTQTMGAVPAPMAQPEQFEQQQQQQPQQQQQYQEPPAPDAEPEAEEPPPPPEMEMPPPTRTMVNPSITPPAQ